MTFMVRDSIGRALVKAAAFVFLLCQFSSLSTPLTYADPLTPDDQAAQVIEAYVSATRKWPRESYRVELHIRQKDGLNFWVTNRDDDVAWKASTMVGGGGKSFAVEVDAKTLGVVREMGFQ